MKKYIFWTLIILVSCKAPKLGGVERLITFGSGGGFTGKVIQYTLSSNGYIYIQGKPGVTMKPKVTKKKLQWIFDESERIRKETPGYSKPGNIYYFITMGDTRNSPDYIWGDATLPPDDVLKLYNELVKTVPKENN